ncbi:hypothetical protein [Granulicoccus sp. GXG6511]|uniref:hypothetical protein n=1 Tax=Granulicoccus sp. GXG6511 TaxID=3381351 RepID=UPI003D7E575A
MEEVLLIPDSPDWWDPDFWGTNRPREHFDTPSSLCAGALSSLFLTWIKEFDLRGLLEIGAGDGAILDEFSARDPLLDCAGVDVRSSPRSGKWQGITAAWDVVHEEWRGRTPPLGSDPQLAIAVEWLDDLPATVACRDQWGRPVALGPSGRTAALTPADARWLERWWPRLEPGGRAVVGHTRDRAWRWLAERLAPGSVLATIDYGHMVDGRPADGGLAAHLRGRPVPPGPGANVTASVAVDSLAAAVEELGAERLWCTRLADLPADFWPVGEARTPLDGLALRSQQALLRDPDRFGAFWLVAHRVGAAREP